jgi:exopolysaccharide biosynthesis polyprenyl glycosylphosphotransferase
VLIDTAPTIARRGELPAATERRQLRLGLRPGTPWTIVCVATDTAMLVLAAVATAFGAEAAGVRPASPLWTGGFAVFVMLLMASRGLYAPTFRLRAIDDVRKLVSATSLSAMSLLALAAVVGAGQAPVDEVVRLWAFATAYVAAGRIALYWSRAQARRAGEGLRPTLIIGAGKVGHLAAKRLLDSPELGLRPIGFLDKDPLADAGNTDLEVLGASWDLDRVVRQHGVQQVIITFSTAPNDVLLRLVRRCQSLGVAVAMVPRLYERTTTRMTVEHIGGLPLVSAHSADPRGWQFSVKYAADRVASVALVVLLAPVLVACAVAVYSSLGRPILFRQRRVGRDGQEFDMLKFRTMRASNDPTSSFQPADGSAPGGVEGADRRTRVGKILRATSLDELPQLFNVLRGQMSLVGPRPERPEFVPGFDRSVYRYGERHRVKAGITGWAQVYGLRGKTSLSDRVEWDNYYIENFSLWLDVKILLMTVAAVFTSYKTVE